MGWTHTQQNFKELIRSRTHGWGTRKLLAKCFKGNPRFKGTLWTVWEYTDDEGKVIRYIGCDMLQYRRDGNYTWLYKDMSDCSGPCVYNCPLKYLQMTSGPNDSCNDGYSASWRVSVLEYHAQKRAKRLARKAV